MTSKLVSITLKSVKNVYTKTKGYFFKWCKNNKSLEKVLRYTQKPEIKVAKRSFSQKIIQFWESNSTRNKIIVILISILGSSSVVYILTLAKVNLVKPAIKYHGYLVPIGKSTLENTWSIPKSALSELQVCKDFYRQYKIFEYLDSKPLTIEYLDNIFEYMIRRKGNIKFISGYVTPELLRLCSRPAPLLIDNV